MAGRSKFNFINWAMEDIIFELNNIHFSYLGKFPALCGLSLKIKPGEKISVIGANGSGKSTLLHILDGIIFSDQGKFSVFGKEVKEADFNDDSFAMNFRKKVGLLFQNPDMQLFCPTVKEDIIFGPLQLGLEKNIINQRMERLITLLNIKDLLDRPPHQLSIGEKRKVAIVSTLMIEPEVLLLDEPTAGLDPMTTRHIIDFLLEESVGGKTIITSTHDLHIVPEISDTVYVFSREKRIVKSGNPQEILSNVPLLEEHNLVHIHSHRHKDKTHTHIHEHLEHHPG